MNKTIGERMGEWLDDKAMLIIESHIKESGGGYSDDGEGLTEMIGNIRFGLAESLIDTFKTWRK